MTLLRRELPAQPAGMIIGERRSPWNVIIPEATTNLVTNPSFETNTTGWTLSEDGSSTFTRVATRSYFGAACGQLFRSGGTTCIAYLSFSGASALTVGAAYTWSLYLMRISSVPVLLEFQQYNSVPTLLQTISRVPLGPNDLWVREKITATILPTTTIVQLAVSSGPTNGTCYFDGVQLEAKAYETTYCDGDQDGCLWTSTPHGSASTRAATERQGGRIWNFRDFKFWTTAMIGTGAAALSTVITPFALVGGGYYQRSIAPPRSFSIVGGFDCSSDIDLRRNRQGMLDAISPFTYDQQPVRLLFGTANCDDEPLRRVVIDAVYTGGLEGDQVNDVGQDRAAVSFTSFLPNVIGYGENDNATDLPNYVSLTTADSIAAQNLTTGVWSTLSTSTNGIITAGAIGKDGFLYVVGSFTSIGGVSANRVAMWNGTTWVALGTGLSGGGYGLDFDANNNLYVVGLFATAGGVTVNNVARWNGSTWAAVGAGTNSTTISVKVVRAGGSTLVYVAGTFNDVFGGGGGNMVGVGRWDGSVWAALGAGLGGSAIGYMLDAAPSGEIYVGGNFTTADGVTCNNIAKWNGTTFEALGPTGSEGMSGPVYTVLYHNGLIYASGQFTTAGGVTVLNIASWNGSTWVSMEGGIDAYASDFTVMPNGNILATGGFLTVGKAIGYGVAEWNGSSWGMAGVTPVNLSQTIIGSAVSSTHLFVYGNYDSGLTVNNTATITNTAGLTYPRIVLKGSGDVYLIRNLTTGKSLWFSEYPSYPGRLRLNVGEEAVLQTGPASGFTSSFRGNLMNTIQPGSNVSDFYLLPGVNYIAVYTSMDTAGSLGAVASASIIYRDAYVSLDQVVR